MAETGSDARGAGRAPLAAGQRVGSYRLERPIGRGGMAEVWVGRHDKTKSLAAIKVLKPEASERVRRLFQTEQRALLRLVHPHIVPVFDIGDDFIAGAFIEGHDLRNRLRTPMDPDEARSIILSIGSVLDYAHRQGVVHCDVKPSNVLLDLNGNAFLADFGIARLLDHRDTVERGAVGTPAYMAPEQMAGAHPTAAADQYALARLVIRMLSGRTASIVPEEAVRAMPDGTDPKLLEALERALQLDPEKRFPSMAKLMEALRAVKIDSARAEDLLVPLRRPIAPFEWASHPCRVERLGEHIARADYTVSSLVEAGALPREAAAAFLERTGQADFGWSMYAREERLGPLAAPASLARARETVILMHGIFTSRELWRDISAGIARNNGLAVVMTPDVLGCGDSPFAHDAPTEVASVSHVVRTVRAWLDLIGAGGILAAYMGHSLSATALLSVRADELPPTVYRICLTPALFDGGFFSTLGMRMNVGLAWAFMAVPKPLLRPFARTAFLFERSLWKLRTEVRHAMADTAVDIGTVRAASMLTSIVSAEPAPPEALGRCYIVTTPDDPLVPPSLVEQTLRRAQIPPERQYQLLHGGHFPHLADDEHPEWAARNLHEIVSLIDNVLDMARSELSSTDRSSTTEETLVT